MGRSLAEERRELTAKIARLDAKIATLEQKIIRLQQAVFFACDQVDGIDDIDLRELEYSIAFERTGDSDVTPSLDDCVEAYTRAVETADGFTLLYASPAVPS